MIVLRNETEGAILQLLADGTARSRADLAREMGVTRSTVGAPTARLLDLGVLQFAGPAEVRAKDVAPRFGRPGERLELTADFCTFVGVDISVGAIRVGLTDLLGAVLDFRTRAMVPETQTPEAVIAAVVQLVREVIGTRTDVAGLTVSVPGIVTGDGVVLRAPSLDWRDVPLTARLRDGLSGVERLHVCNDASLFAAAFSSRSPDLLGGNGVVVWLDTGIGGGLVANGSVINGTSGLAGEIGHMFISARDGTALQRLEDVAGSWALLSRNMELGGDARSIEALLDAHRAGDPAALHALDDWSHAMAEGLTNLTSLMDPGVMLFSGPMAVVLAHLEAETFAAYTSMLHYGTQPARWQIDLSDERTLVQSGAVLLRHDLLSYREAPVARALASPTSAAQR